MEIFHFAKQYYPDVGGIESATRDLAEAAVSEGVRVKCVAACSPKDMNRMFIHNGVVVEKFAAKKFFSSPVSFELFFQKFPLDSVIHLHLPNPLAEIRVILALLWNPKMRSKVVPFFHAFPVGQGLLGRAWFFLITARIFSLVDHILISNEDFFRSFPVLNKWKGKFHVLPFFAVPIEKAKLRSLFHHRLQEKNVLAIGRLVKYKGYDFLLRAWQEIESTPRMEKMRLTIIGEGPERAKLEKLIGDLGLKRVYLLGSKDEKFKNEMLAASCLFVAPSISEAETFGISILEAMSYGLPIVTTSLKTGVAQLARDGRCGGVVPVKNAEALAASILKILENLETSLHEIGNENLDFVESEFSIDLGKRKYLNFIRDHFTSLS